MRVQKQFFWELVEKGQRRGVTPRRLMRRQCRKCGLVKKAEELFRGTAWGEEPGDENEDT